MRDRIEPTGFVGRHVMLPLGRDGLLLEAARAASLPEGDNSAGDIVAWRLRPDTIMAHCRTLSNLMRARIGLAGDQPILNSSNFRDSRGIDC